MPGHYHMVMDVAKTPNRQIADVGFFVDVGFIAVGYLNNIVIGGGGWLATYALTSFLSDRPHTFLMAERDEPQWHPPLSP